MRRHQRLLPVTAVLLALLLVAGLGVAQLAGAANDLRKAEDLVDEAAAALEDGRLGDAEDALAAAQSKVLSANERVRTSLPLRMAGMIPVASTNLDILKDSIDVAADTIYGGSRILDASSPLEGPDGRLEVSLDEGAMPVEAVERAQVEIAALLTELAPLRDAPPSRWVAPPIRTLHDAVYEAAVERRDHLRVLSRGLSLLREIAGVDAPRRYVIAVANTAEMRGTGGMILNFGLLEGQDGAVDLTHFGRIDEFPLVTPLAETVVPADYLERWRGFDPLSRVRQANLAADFELVAPVLEEMFTSATRLPVNGVIQIDPQGLAAILEGVGPVDITGLGRVDASNVVPLTLNEAYIRFPDVDQRSDILGDVAEAALRKLVDGEFPSIRRLAEAIATAVDGRHIIVHANTEEAQREIAMFGADGSFPGLDDADAIGFTAQNLSGNKLDYYLDTHLALTGDLPDGDLGALQLAITLDNTAPAGATSPQYIFGPGPGPTAQPAGVLRSLVTVYLPFGTNLVGSAGDKLLEPVSTGTEGGRPYASFIVDVPASSTRRVELSFRTRPLPPGDQELLVMPSPRVRPTTVEVDVTTDSGPLVGEVSMDRTWRFASDREPVAVLAPAFR